MTATQAIKAAYTVTAAAWADGPDAVYDRLARVLLQHAPVNLRGRRLIDLGSGAGAATRAIRAAGARAVAVDLAAPMVAAATVPIVAAATVPIVAAATVPIVAAATVAGVAADARALPFRDGAVDGVVAAFCLNHIDPPAAGLAEARRVTARGGCVLASSFGADDDHPVKAAVSSALRAVGYDVPQWYVDMQVGPAAALGTAGGMAAAAAMAGLSPTCLEVDVDFPDLEAGHLVSWRMGMAHIAPFLAGLSYPERFAVRQRALDLLGSAPVLVRRMVVLSAVAR